eukprot:236154_1
MLLSQPGLALVLPVVARYSHCIPFSYCMGFRLPWTRAITAPSRTTSEGVWEVPSQCSSRRAKRRRLLRKNPKGILYPHGVLRTLNGEAVMAEKEKDMVVSDRTEHLAEEEYDSGEVAGLRLVKYPHPSLRAKNDVITEFSNDLQQLSRSMFELMYASNGAGLAAPQVGLNKRLIVINLTGDKEEWTEEVVLANPEIVERSKKKDMDEEGCLSFPKMSGDVPRNTWIKVKYDTVQGKCMKKKLIGLEARIFQHEYDHVEGILYIDHLSPEERRKVQGRLDELVADYGYGGVL